MLNVTLLGTGGMMPLPNRALASAALSANGRRVLIDCGEGTQVRMRACHLSFKPIDAILITHFHGDHVSGLPGLLMSMGNQGRTEEVLIAGPTGLKRVVESLRVIAPGLPFEVRYLEIDPGAPEPFECAGLQVRPFALEHGIPCLGYRLELQRPGRFLPERAQENGVPLSLWNALQRNETAALDGVTYTRDMVMTPPRRGIAVTYATDTRPVPAIEHAARDCDLLIAEGMYGDPEKLPRAREAGHMLMEEAAEIAARANARRLWLTHYSPAMTDPGPWMPRVLQRFPEATPGSDGLSIELNFED